jgi:hypothetical protein
MTKDPIQRQIEYIALGFWAGLCALSLAALGKDFALGVFLGGALCVLNYQWLYSHARTAITLPGRKGSSYMAFKYVIRLAVMAVAILALIRFAHVNIVALLVGLSVIMLGIVSYACYTTFFDRGEE